MNSHMCAGMFCALFLSVQLYAQNLIPNGSFELFDTCPTGLQQIYRAVPWFQPNIAGGNTTNSSSTDLFHNCTSNPTCDNPANTVGFQYPITGNSYAGIGVYFPPPNENNGREYLQVELTSSLIAGKKYCISFYASLANYSKYCIDAIGCYFSNDSLLYASPSFVYIPVVPSMSNPMGNIICDTVAWTFISGLYNSIGNEKFITIGNFAPSGNIVVDSVNGGSGPAYYYIDDVSVTLCDSTPVEEEFFLPTAFSPNNDGNNDLWRISGEKPDAVEIAVYDRWGNEVFRTTDPAFSWDGNFKGMALPMGVCFYYMKGMLKEDEISQSGNLTLVR